MSGFTTILATTPEEKAEVYRLRHRIYVQEMGICPQEHEFVQGDQLIDPWDARSDNLLLRYEGRAVGTIRITCATGGLELETAVGLASWLADPDRAKAAEITRLMVDRRYRGVEATASLFLELYRVLVRRGYQQVFVAGKVGSLSNYWKNFGFVVLPPAPFMYPLVPGSRYKLMLWRLPGRRCWNQRLRSAFFEAAGVLVPRLPTRFGSGLFRRGLSGFKRARTSQPIGPITAISGNPDMA